MTSDFEGCLFQILSIPFFPYFKLYLFYNDYETSYTTCINHARWHRCLRSDGLRVGGNRSTRRKWQWTIVSFSLLRDMF